MKYQEVFSKANGLPLHHPYDCAIELMPGATPQESHILSLSHGVPSHARVHFRNTRQGYIQPSTSPASADFVGKKRGGLQHCTGYQMTIKYPYLLPLVPSTLEQLREAKNIHETGPSQSIQSDSH